MQVKGAQFIAASQTLESLPGPAYAEIAFAGRSNVGKSSLINTLVQRRNLVRTSSTPGCTRTISIFRAEIGDAVLDLVDLPGYGYAQRSKSERRSWGPLIESFLETRPGLRAVVLIVDARRGLEADDEELLEFLRAVKRRAIVIATKLDKLPLNKRKPRLLELQRESGVRLVGFSSEDRTGRDELWKLLLHAAGIQLDGQDSS